MATINMPVQQEDALTKIAKGLQIAQSIYGIKTNMAQLDAFDRKEKESENAQSLSDAALQRQKSGELTQPEVLAAAKESNIVATTAEDTSPLHRFYMDATGKRRDFLVIPNKQPQKTFEQEKELAQIAHPEKEGGQFKPTSFVDQEGRLIFANDQGKTTAGPVVQKLDNAKPKLATGSEASQIGSFNSALSTLDDIGSSWNEKAAATGSGLRQYIKGTDASKFNDERRQAAQTIGRVLEGGKLSDQDVGRYEKMLPGPEDSAAQARNKTISLKKKIISQRNSQVQGLAQAGYDVSGIPAIPDQNVDTVIGKSSAGGAIAAPGGRPKTVIQNGHTYILNEATGNYE